MLVGRGYVLILFIVVDVIEIFFELIVRFRNLISFWYNLYLRGFSFKLFFRKRCSIIFRLWRWFSNFRFIIITSSMYARILFYSNFRRISCIVRWKLFGVLYRLNGSRVCSYSLYLVMNVVLCWFFSVIRNW